MPASTPDLPAPSAARPAAPTPERDASGRRLWRAGTLVYGSGGLALLFFWLLWGDFAWNLKERAIGPVGTIMLKEFQASDFMLGLITASLPSALGLIIAPIVSVRSDRHRGRWGRRLPYLLVPTPFIALSMIGLGCTVPVAAVLHEALGAASPGEMTCRILVFGLFWTTFEIFQTIAQSVFVALCNDVVPQAVIGRFFGLFRAVSLGAAIVFNLFIIGHAREHFMPIMIGLGVVFGVGFTVMCLFVREGSYPPPSPPPPAVSLRERFVSPLLTYLRECYATPYYLWVFSATMLAGMAGVPINTYSLPYARSLGISDTDYGRLLVTTYCVSIALTFVMGWLADRFHPLRVGLAAISLYAVVMVWGGFFATDARSFSVVFVAHGVLMGAYLTGTASLGSRLFPPARFAQFGSAAGIFGAVCYMVLAPGIGLWLDATGRQYHYTFLGGGVIAVAAVTAYLGVCRRFNRLGGVRAYVAP